MEALPNCKYGEQCFRKNADHIKKYRHCNEETDKKDESESVPDSEVLVEKEDNVESRRESLEKNSSKRMKLSNEVTIEQNENIDKFDLTTVENIKEFVLEHNRMQMPDDFYELLDFCKSINPQNPKNAMEVIDMELVGVYDLVLFGHKLNYKMHSRYYYDPPEFQTVLSIKGSDSLLHFGYFRDDPLEMPSFVAMNEAKLDGKIISLGDNLFSAINWYINELMSKKTYTTNSTNMELAEFKKKLTDWCDSHHKNDRKFSVQAKTIKMKAREKKVNCKTLHTAGLVVPVTTSGFGYREVPETLESQKKMFTSCCSKADEKSSAARKRKGEDDIQEIITLIQFANDETDYGMGLEFGLNMFTFGDMALHKYIRATLPVCYMLLGRDLYAETIREHLKNRKLTN